MIVYHGSNSNFKRLKIAKDLVRFESTVSNEGYGIYFSTYREVAESYGKYLYTLEIDDKQLLNFKNNRTCLYYLNNLKNYIREKTEINIYDYISYNGIANYMQYGGIAIWGVGREIYMQLDSIEEWHASTSESKRNKVYSILRGYNKRSLKAYIFNYHIRGVGVIKDVSEDVVKIISKEKLH